MMQSAYIYKPVLFFLITFLATWVLWFIAAYFSYQQGKEKAQLFLILASLFVPCMAALIMIYGSRNQELIQDFWNRLFLFRINQNSLLIILFLMPAVLFSATAISLLFGKSADQFRLADQYSVMKGWSFLGILIPFVLAPMLEEFGWRGYGVDSLRAYFNVFSTTMLFALLWGMWHLPLFFIKGYYQNELWNLSIVYVINFFVSILPAAVLTNWVYFTNERSIPAVILMHSMMNIFSIIFKTDQFTKCIVTLLLCVVAILIIVKNEVLFFGTAGR